MRQIIKVAMLSALACFTSALSAQIPTPNDLLEYYLSEKPYHPNTPFAASMGYLAHYDDKIQELLTSPQPNIELARLSGHAQLCLRAVGSRSSNPLLPTLYKQDGQCTAVSALDAKRDWYYTDQQCSNSIEYKQGSDTQYCLRNFDYTARNYGNSRDLNHVQDAWIPGYQSTLPITTLPHSTTQLPLLQRNTYKTTYNKNGACHLEMRVYKKANSHNATPLMLIHGGGWVARQDTGRLAEVQIAHFTEAGFMVYMPFYRLVSNVGDAGAKCNNVDIEESKQDIKDAFLWAQNNNSNYTTSDKSIRIMGQSAGGHMAVWLSQQFPDKIDKIAPMFPVPDFAHQLQEVQNGSYDKSYIKWMLTQLTGKVSWQDLSMQDPIITNNSLLQSIEIDPDNAPAMFISHAMKDDIVSVSQAMRLCNATSGDIIRGPAQKNSLIFNEQHSITQCNAKSELHLLEFGSHHFDVCYERPCDEGGLQGEQAIKSIMTSMINWLK